MLRRSNRGFCRVISRGVSSHKKFSSRIMATTFRFLALINGGAVHCSRRSQVHRFYSNVTTIPGSRDWRTAGHPAPRSILDDEDHVDLSEDNEIVNGARPNTPPLHKRNPPDHPTPLEHRSHRMSIKKAFPTGWSPPRKLSREAMDGLRQLHHYDSGTFSTPVLAEKFRISPEAVRRILKSKWEPTREQRARYAERERKKRDAFIQSSRMEERTLAMELQRQRRLDREAEDIEPGTNVDGGRVRGINARDKLTFQ